MFDNLKQPLYVDFNEMDEEGLTILSPFKDLHLNNIEYSPSEGQSVWVSDGDIEIMGTLVFRDGKYWAVNLDKKTKKRVPRTAWYHIDNS